MPHEIYKDDTRDIGYDIFTKNRDTGKDTAVALASGVFTLLSSSGTAQVSASAITVSNSNKGTFRLKPSNGGSSTIGVFKEVWLFFIGQESFTKSDSLTVLERF